MQSDIINDKDLHPLLAGQDGILTPEAKRTIVISTLINGYALAFDLRQLELIKNSTWNAYVADMRGFFSGKEVQARWDDVKPEQEATFVQFVDETLLRKSGV